MCIKNYVIVLRPIFGWTYKGKKQVKIYMWDLHHELVLFQKSSNCFHYVPENDIEGGILGWTTSIRIWSGVLFIDIICGWSQGWWCWHLGFTKFGFRTVFGPYCWQHGRSQVPRHHSIWKNNPEPENIPDQVPQQVNPLNCRS